MLKACNCKGNCIIACPACGGLTVLAGRSKWPYHAKVAFLFGIVAIFFGYLWSWGPGCH